MRTGRGARAPRPSCFKVGAQPTAAANPPTGFGPACKGGSGLIYAQVPLVEPQFIEQLVHLAQPQAGGG